MDPLIYVIITLISIFIVLLVSFIRMVCKATTQAHFKTDALCMTRYMVDNTGRKPQLLISPFSPEEIKEAYDDLIVRAPYLANTPRLLKVIMEHTLHSEGELDTCTLAIIAAVEKLLIIHRMSPSEKDKFGAGTIEEEYTNVVSALAYVSAKNIVAAFNNFPMAHTQAGLCGLVCVLLHAVEVKSPGSAALVMERVQSLCNTSKQNAETEMVADTEPVDEPESVVEENT